jgi:hypothetical protein
VQFAHQAKTAEENQATHLVPSGAKLEDRKHKRRQKQSVQIAHFEIRRGESGSSSSAIWCQVGAKIYRMNGKIDEIWQRMAANALGGLTGWNPLFKRVTE